MLRDRFSSVPNPTLLSIKKDENLTSKHLNVNYFVMLIGLNMFLPGQDKFFLWAILILPIISMCAYIFDAYLYLDHRSNQFGYEGLISTILIVFAYLPFCIPVESKVFLIVYFVLLWILNQTGNVLYLISFFETNETFNFILFIGWSILDLITSSLIIYCRAILQRKVQFHVENKHIFHFLSRLEVILAIFTPIFLNKKLKTMTRDTIGFFLLFDYFSDSYERFQSVWIKSTLYLFVGIVSISVGSEWAYFNTNIFLLEQISMVTELMGACFCSILIVIQFFPGHFIDEHEFDDENRNFQRISTFS